MQHNSNWNWLEDPFMPVYTDHNIPEGPEAGYQTSSAAIIDTRTRDATQSYYSAGVSGPAVATDNANLAFHTPGNFNMYHFAPHANANFQTAPYAPISSFESTTAVTSAATFRPPRNLNVGTIAPSSLQSPERTTTHMPSTMLADTHTPNFNMPTPGSFRFSAFSPYNQSQHLGTTPEIPTTSHNTSAMIMSPPVATNNVPENIRVSPLPVNPNLNQASGSAPQFLQSNTPALPGGLPNVNGGIAPNVFDFMFVDRGLIKSEETESSTSGVSQFLASMEETVNEKDNQSDFALQSFLVQQQLLAGISPERVRTMFYGRSPDDKRPLKKRVLSISNANDLETGAPDRPRWDGDTPPVPAAVRKALMYEFHTTEPQQLQLEKFYSQSFRNLSGLGPGSLPDSHAAMEQVLVNSGDADGQNEGTPNDLKSLFEDDGMDLDGPRL